MSVLRALVMDGFGVFFLLFPNAIHQVEAEGGFAHIISHIGPGTPSCLGLQHQHQQSTSTSKRTLNNWSSSSSRSTSSLRSLVSPVCQNCYSLLFNYHWFDQHRYHRHHHHLVWSDQHQHHYYPHHHYSSISSSSTLWSAPSPILSSLS